MENRELDALVAEKVFGWKWSTFLDTHYLLHPHDYEQNMPNGGTYLGWTPGKEKGSKPGRTEEHFIDSSRRYDRFRKIEPYSTDIASAFQVQDKVRWWCWLCQIKRLSELHLRGRIILLTVLAALAATAVWGLVP